MSDEHEASRRTHSRRPDSDADSLTHHLIAKPATILHRGTPPESHSNLEDRDPSYLLKMPGEILNKIARLVLAPGRVTAITSHHSNSQVSEGNPPNRFSLLVVCRQVYQDHILLFYGENVFCLPPGPVANAELYFNQLVPAHQVKMRHVAVPFSLAGADPSTIYRIARNPMDTRLLRACVGEYANTWAVKLDLVCDFYENQLKRGSQGLMEVLLEYGGNFRLPCVILGGNDIVQGLTNISKAEIDYPSFPPKIRNKIMEFALLPGDVYPPYSRNGVQFLATNRKAVATTIFSYWKCISPSTCSLFDVLP